MANEKTKERRYIFNIILTFISIALAVLSYEFKSDVLEYSALGLCVFSLVCDVICVLKLDHRKCLQLIVSCLCVVVPIVALMDKLNNKYDLHLELEFDPELKLALSIVSPLISNAMLCCVCSNDNQAESHPYLVVETAAMLQNSSINASL